MEESIKETNEIKAAAAPKKTAAKKTTRKTATKKTTKKTAELLSSERQWRNGGS